MGFLSYWQNLIHSPEMIVLGVWIKSDYEEMIEMRMYSWALVPKHIMILWKLKQSHRITTSSYSIITTMKNVRWNARVGFEPINPLDVLHPILYLVIMILFGPTTDIS